MCGLRGMEGVPGGVFVDSHLCAKEIKSVCVCVCVCVCVWAVVAAEINISSGGETYGLGVIV